MTKRLVRWAATLYPSTWRERYGAEFEALLEDADPRGSDVWDVVKEAGVMRITRSGLGKLAVACGLAGGLAAGVWTMAAFSGYTSTGLIRSAWQAPQIDDQIALSRTLQQALSRSSLAELVQRPNLNLYPEERRKLPLEDVIAKMRRDISVRSVRVPNGPLTVSVAFHYPDAVLAQKTVDALMEKLRAELVAKAPVTIQSATSAQATLEGKRGKLVAIGVVSGMMVGMLAGLGWGVVQNRQRWNLRLIGGLAAAGTAVGLVVAFLIPNQYISTAVLRARGPENPEALLQRVMSDESLSAIVRDEGLYKAELEKLSMADVVRRMKAKSLRVQRTDTPVTAYVVSFQDRDPVLAQKGARALTAAWMRANVETGSSVIDVLDPASYPESPAWPNRSVIGFIGLLAGSVTGLAIAGFGRRSAHPAGLAG